MNKVEIVTRNGRVMAKCRVANKVYFGVGEDEVAARADLSAAMAKDTFALFDMDAYTSAHNSAVRTRA